jgi:hypothetical protein
MRKVYPTKIDPERVRFQLDLLATAIWKNAEREVRKELKAAEAAPTHPKGLTMPLTLNSKTQ